MHVGRRNNQWTVKTVSYIHTHPTPCTLIIIITLTNHQSNIIQYNFHKLSITITSSSLVLKLQWHLPSQKLTFIVCDWPSTQWRLSLPSISYKTHPLSQPATSNSVVAACGATVLVSLRQYKFHRGDPVIPYQSTAHIIRIGLQLYRRRWTWQLVWRVLGL
jgi:hypothetical protein